MIVLVEVTEVLPRQLPVRFVIKNPRGCRRFILFVALVVRPILLLEIHFFHGVYERQLRDGAGVLREDVLDERVLVDGLETALEVLFEALEVQGRPQFTALFRIILVGHHLEITVPLLANFHHAIKILLGKQFRKVKHLSRHMLHVLIGPAKHEVVDCLLRGRVDARIDPLVDLALVVLSQDEFEGEVRLDLRIAEAHEQGEEL